MQRARWVVAVVMVTASVGWADVAGVTNGSFERGKDAPDGWKLSGGKGGWVDGGCDGKRAVAVTGGGADSNYWRTTGRIAFEPSTVYRLRFRARMVSGAGAGGTPVSGPAFCNVDPGQIGGEWTSHEYCFVTPAKVAPPDAWLRFGQWHVKGTVAFDAVELYRAEAVHRRTGGIELGRGESVAGRTYTFQAPLGKDGRNHCRPLVRHQCQFNSQRWVFGTGSEVVYRHGVAGRRQSAASVSVNVSYYRGGRLAVEVGRDGKSWREIGTISAVTGETFAVPKEFLALPAESVWVRLRGLETDGQAASVQVIGYTYRSQLDGEPISMRGGTTYVTQISADPRVKVTIEDLGEALPGGRNVARLRVENTTGKTIVARPTVVVECGSGRETSSLVGKALRPGVGRVEIGYKVPATGRQRLVLTLGKGVGYRAEAVFRVSELYDASYGQILGPSKPAVALWWASSGWKIPRSRGLPSKRCEAVVIRAAANEAEAAQLVVRPKEKLRGLTARAGALRGPGGATIPAESVKLLRVRYVNVTQPTDATGTVAPWPDPLPPFTAPIDVPAGRNQPIWVRVKVPRDAKAGTYKGTVKLTAAGFEADVPLHVVVYGFVLPDRMTCGTAFGFSPGVVWRYQGITDAKQKRVVLEKYLRNLGEHHISPYNPAPLDPFRVTWENLPAWTGGRRDTQIKHGGAASVKVDDQSRTSTLGCSYGKNVPIPKKGLRLRLWYKADKGHAFIVTLRHHDKAGKWISGGNNDIRLEGTGDWAELDRTISSFPKRAASVRLNLWAARWADDGSTTGTVWYDDLSLQDAGSGKELVTGGDFEPTTATPRPKFDFTAWDKAMTKAIDEYHFNRFNVPIQGMGGGTFHARHEPSLLGYAEDTPEYQAAFTAYCRTLQEHLREKGWLDEAFIYWFDEPAPKDYEFVANGFRKLKRAAPDIHRMLTEQVEGALIGGPNIWCPVSHNYNHDDAEKRRARGEKFWWYVCCGPKAPYCTLFIDHPATELRVWLWQTWQRKIDSILIWQTNYWTSSAAYPDPKHPQDPYADPMGWVSGYSTPKGTRRAWGNGDGRFIYPPEAAADGKPAKPVLDGPVDSIRWEMLRDGIEDYEYLVILKRLLARRGEKLPDARRRRYSALLAVPPEITATMTEFTKDPAPIERRRDEIARAIEELTRL